MGAPILVPTSEWPDVIRAIRDSKILVIGQDDIKNQAQAEVAAAVIRALGSSPAGFIYIEPCTARTTRRPPDVVVCHPEFGVVVFEVKGYFVSGIESVNAGSLFVRHQGRVSGLNPFRQAESAMFDIKHQFERFGGSSSTLPAFHAVVVLPNITQAEWKVKGFTNCFPDQVLLLKDELAPERLRAKLKHLVANHACPLTREQTEGLKTIFGDSATINGTRDPRPEVPESTLGAMIDEIAVQDKYLSAEQTELSRLPIGGFPRLIRGVAGSGKTVVLANLAARLLTRTSNANPILFDDFEDDHLRIGVVCFNRALVSFLRQKIKDAYKQQSFEDIPSGDVLWVGHLNSLMRKVTYGKGSDFQYLSIDVWPKAVARANEYEKQLNQYLAKHAQQENHILYDAIFVDEGQDFEPAEIQLLLSLLKPDRTTGEKNLIIFYDDAQNLYGRQRPSWKQLGIDVQRGDRARVMKECFRNTRQIVETAFNVLLGSEASDDEKVNLKSYADVGYLRQAGLIEETGGFYKVGFAERSGEYPRVHEFGSRSEEKTWIVGEIERLIGIERVRPEDILVLFSSAGAFDDLGDMIRTRIGKERIKDFIRPYGNNGEKDALIFRDNCLTLSTVHGAKGYDAYIVFLVGLDLFKPDEAGRASYYVGATRSKLSLYVSGLNSDLLIESKRVVSRARALRRDNE